MIPTCFPGEPVRIGAAWRHAVLAHLLALDADDRYARFATALSDAGIAAYVRGIDLQRDICLATTDPAGRTSGFIHLAVAGAVAELGASVQPRWRRQGLARRLFAAAVGFARAGGLREIHLATAHPVARRIFASLGYACTLQLAYPRGVVAMEPEHGGTYAVNQEGRHARKASSFEPFPLGLCGESPRQ